MSRIAVVIGDPIEHSLSPAIHNAAFAATGLDYRFETRRVPVDGVPAIIRQMREEHWLGMSVTMPDKEAIVACVDGLTPIATALAAVNCVYWDGDALAGDNTDGAGAVWALREYGGVADFGVTIGVIGAGGAARACIAALAAAGAGEIVVVNRTTSRAEAAAALAPGVARVGGRDDLGRAAIVINATPVGMAGSTAPEGATGASVGPGVVAMDLVYHPADTPWLAAARRSGATTVNGVPMLVGQAAAAFERWTGRKAPISAMTSAAERGLESRS